MKIKAEIEFEMSDKEAENLGGLHGIGVDSFFHDEIDMVMNHKGRSSGYEVVGIAIGNASSGTLKHP